MGNRIERESKWLPFFVPCGMPTGSGCRFGVRFFRVRQSRFYYISIVSVVFDDFTIRVSGEPSRASDERNDFLILTNERPIRFYYLFRSRTSRAIFLYWPTIAIFIFFEEPRGIPSRLTGLTLEQSAGVAESAEDYCGYEGVFEDYAHNLCRILIHDS